MFYKCFHEDPSSAVNAVDVTFALRRFSFVSIAAPAANPLETSGGGGGGGFIALFKHSDKQLLTLTGEGRPRPVE